MSKIDTSTRNHLKKIQLSAQLRSDGVEATSMIIASDDWKIHWTDGVYKELLGLPDDYEAASLIDVCETVIGLGWKNAEVKAGDGDNNGGMLITPSDGQILTSFFCSPEDDLVYLNYYKDEFSGQLCVFLASSNEKHVTINREPSSNLPCLKFLTEDGGQTNTETGHPLAAFPDKDYVLAEAFFSLSGNLKFLDTKNSGDWLSQDIQTIDGLGYSVHSVHRAINDQGEFKTINSTLHPDVDVIVSIRKQPTYPHGPSFLRCSVQAMGARLTAERIKAYFPMFTKRETEVVLLLARGNSLKEISGMVGRAQGTVTIQARSATQKAQARSLVALVSRVCQMCA